MVAQLVKSLSYHTINYEFNLHFLFSDISKNKQTMFFFFATRIINDVNVN